MEKIDWLLGLQCAPIRGRVQKILTWRWKEPPKIADELDHVTPHSPNKKKVWIFTALTTHVNVDLCNLFRFRLIAVMFFNMG